MNNVVESFATLNHYSPSNNSLMKHSLKTQSTHAGEQITRRYDELELSPDNQPAERLGSSICIHMPFSATKSSPPYNCNFPPFVRYLFAPILDRIKYAPLHNIRRSFKIGAEWWQSGK